MRTCPTCRVLYPADTQFCPADGTPLHEAAPSEPSSDLPIGMMVGEYRVTGKVGEGGMGTVYAGIHPVIGKKVAIKLLNPNLATDPGAISRFVSEARSVNHIQHPNIVDIFSFDRLADDNRHYFVMELLEGRTLKEEIERQAPMPAVLALHVLWQVCDALEAAHARGIFHRDLKPDNVYLVERATAGVFVKLLDFGIAKLTGEAGVGLSHTRTGVPMGTPFYMSPEQCRGVGVDHRTDIYSLGVMMYEIFTGQLPFTGSSYIDVIQGHLSTPPRPPTELAGVSESLSQVILRAMSKDPEGRQQSATELKRDLERLAREAGMPLASAAVTGAVYDLPLTTPARPPAAPAPTPSFAVPGKTVGPPKTSRPSTYAMVGGIAAVAVAAVAVLMLRGKPTVEPITPAPIAAAPVPVAATPPPAVPVPAPAPPAVGKLIFAVAPAATLVVDGQDRGNGSNFAIEVPPGTHEIVLEAPGHQPYRETVALTAGADLTRAVTLTAEKGARTPRRTGSRDRGRAKTSETPVDTAAPGAAPSKTGDATLDPFR